MKSEKWIVCRVCLEQPKEEAMQNIFSEDNEKDLTRMILECGGVPIKQFDHYPDKICGKCLKLLRLSYTFRLTCQRSYKHLSRFIAPVEVEQPAITECNDIVEDDASQATAPQSLDEFVEHEPQDVFAELTDECLEGDQIGIKVETGEDDLKDFVQEVSEVYYEDVYETYDGIEEVQKSERAPSEISAEIEFLDEFDDFEPGDTSDEEYEPEPVKTRKRAATAKKSTAAAKRLNSQSASQSSVGENAQSGGTSGRSKQRGAKGDKNNSLLKYICDVCGNMYHTQGRLTEHIKLHSGIKPHECEICGHRFAQTQQLARHMNTHTGNRPFKCQYCSSAFADLSTRNKHHRIHTNERPYVCDVCGKSFTYTNTLKFHKMIHTGEKPHVCDICGKGFQQANKLRNHKRTHEKRGSNTNVKIEMDDGGALHMQNIDAVTTATIMEM